MNRYICPKCGADKESYFEMMGTPCCPRNGFILAGVNGDQYAAWMSPNTHICSNVYGDRPAPLPHNLIGRN